MKMMNIIQAAPTGLLWVNPCKQGQITAQSQCNHSAKGTRKMPNVTIVYWRDIPAQVIVGKGRRASKVQLSERFEQAIDRAAMKVGAAGSDAYLAEWRRGAPFVVEGAPDQIATDQAARLETEFDKDRIIQLIENNGWASAQ